MPPSLTPALRPVAYLHTAAVHLAGPVTPENGVDMLEENLWPWSPISCLSSCTQARGTAAAHLTSQTCSTTGFYVLNLAHARHICTQQHGPADALIRYQQLMKSCVGFGYQASLAPAIVT